MTTAAELPLDDAAMPSEALAARALVQRVRWHTGLSQEAFAAAFRIRPELLKALEEGAVRADPTLLAYLTVIDHAPGVVRDALR